MNCLFSRTFHYMGKLYVSIPLGLSLFYFYKAPENLRVSISKPSRHTLAPTQERSLLLFIEQREDLPLAVHLAQKSSGSRKLPEAHFIPWILRAFCGDGPPRSPCQDLSQGTESRLSLGALVPRGSLRFKSVSTVMSQNCLVSRHI